MMNQSGFFFGMNVVIVRGFVNTLLSGLHPIVGQSLRFLWWPFGDFLLEVCFFNSHNIGYPKWWALENVSPVTASPCKYGHCWYPPKFSHGTWKWHPWIGDSFWKPSLFRFHVKLGECIYPRCSTYWIFTYIYHLTTSEVFDLIRCRLSR